MNNVLEVKNVSKKYKHFALDNISFNVKKGMIHLLIGSNGSGKTTTTKIIIGASNLDAGKILINKHKHESIEAKKDLSYVSSSLVFPKLMKVQTYVKEIGLLNGLSRSEIVTKSAKLYKEFKLEKFKTQLLSRLSSGEKRKVLLTSALISNPKLIIFDEPLTNLDFVSSNTLIEKIKEIKSQGIAVLIISHDEKSLLPISNHVTIIENGKLLFTDTKAKYIKKGGQKFHTRLINRGLKNA